MAKTSLKWGDLISEPCLHFVTFQHMNPNWRDCGKSVKKYTRVYTNKKYFLTHSKNSKVLEHENTGCKEMRQKSRKYAGLSVENLHKSEINFGVLHKYKYKIQLWIQDWKEQEVRGAECREREEKFCERVVVSFWHQISLPIDKYIYTNQKYTFPYCTNTNEEKWRNMKTELCKRAGASSRHQLSLTDSRFCLPPHRTASSHAKAARQRHKY